MQDFPKDIISVICNFILIDSITLKSKDLCEDIRLLAEKLLKIFQNVNILEPTLNKLKLMFILAKRYSFYTRQFNMYQNSTTIQVDKTYPIKPKRFIYTLLGSECNLPFIPNYFEYKKIEYDLKQIIELFPNLIHYSKGEMRCRRDISCLTLACFNENVSVDIIKLLIENGADVNHKILVNYEKTSIIDDIKNNNLERYNLIKHLFNN